MYWNNPLIQCEWPGPVDPVSQSFHKGQHCLFYDPSFEHRQVKYQQSLIDLGSWANRCIDKVGVDKFFDNPTNHYDIANLVKLNLWIADIQQQGIVKPMLINFANNVYTCATGESRLRALECLPNTRSVVAFIGTHNCNKHLFEHLQPVNDFNHFASLCGAVSGQKFLFRLTDKQADYGIDWFEYDSNRTVSVTPGQNYCVAVLKNYLLTSPNTIFDHNWFRCLVDWQFFENS